MPADGKRARPEELARTDRELIESGRTWGLRAGVKGQLSTRTRRDRPCPSIPEAKPRMV
jgi:hypothetical protein